MIKRILLYTLLLAGINSIAQDKMYIYRKDNHHLGANIDEIDSIGFITNTETGLFKVNDSVYKLPLNNIDSLIFGEDKDTVLITYNGNKVSIMNPFAFEGIDIQTSGADVTVYSSYDSKGVNFALSGSTTNGTFKLYSESGYNLILNNVGITNSDGPAINLQSGKKVYVTVAEGSSNTLTDGASYADAALDSEGEEEDQKAAFFGEGKMVFSGSGSLTINGNGDDQHALASDDWIEFDEAELIISSATKDGIHAKDGFTQLGGSIEIKASSDGIDGDDEYLTISGGTTDITVSGDKAKGLKSTMDMNLDGGEITITTSGGVELESSGSGYDPSYCNAISCDDTITISGTQLTISASGKSANGISSDETIIINSGAVDITCSGNGGTYTNEDGEKDTYHASCLKTDGDVIINNGTVTLTNSGDAGKGISCDADLYIGTASLSPTVNVTCTGDEVEISGGGGGRFGSNDGDADESKTIKSDKDVYINNGNITLSSTDDAIKADKSITIDNATVTINNSVEGIEAPEINVSNSTVEINASDDGFNATSGNGGESNDGSLLKITSGTIIINVSGGDGLDSNGDIEISGGTIIVHGPKSSPEVGLDYNGTCKMTGGFLVVSGISSQQTQAVSNSSTLYCVKATSNTQQSAGKLFHIETNAGTDIVTFAPNRAYSSVIFSSSNLTSGSTYKIFTGGSYTGGTENNGVYTGGSYSDGTQKSSFTISGTVTSSSF